MSYGPRGPRFARETARHSLGGAEEISTKQATRSPLWRLLQVILELKSGRYPNANELAESCDVSRRTIFRDLNSLIRAGVPVKFRADRQGYGVASGFFFDPPRLSEDEVVSLILLAHGTGGVATEPVRRAARSGALKCAEGLPSEERGRALALAEAVVGGKGHCVMPPGRLEVYEAVVRALCGRRQLRVWYREPGESDEFVSKISPYRLLLEGETWCLVGRSSLHREVRVLRLPWARRVELTDDHYEVPPRFRADRHLRPEGSDDGPMRVELRFSPRVAPEVVESPWPSTQRIEHEPGGGVRLSLSADHPDRLARWVREFGAEVEVLTPKAFRQRIRREALRVAQAHRGPGSRPAPLAAGGVSGGESS